MAQTQAPVHILRRRNANKSIREMYAEAQSELAAVAPLTHREPDQDDPKWVEKIEDHLERLFETMRLMKGYSDRNRYKYRSDSVDVVDKLVMERWLDTMETFRTGKGHRVRFDLKEYLKK